MNAQSKRQNKYDQANTARVYIKLNLKTDADILAKLDTVESRQGYIKKLIRDDLERARTGNE